MADSVKIQFRNELIADFFAGTFGSSHKSTVKISRSNDIGKFVYSLVKYSDFPLPPFSKSAEHYIVIDAILPDNVFNTADSHYIYFTKEDQQRINDYVTAYFNQEIRAYLIMGQELKLLQKDIIEIFMANYHLDPVKHSGLIKKDYRWRMKVKEKISQIAKAYGM
jgi:hypothetical protein